MTIHCETHTFTKGDSTVKKDAEAVCHHCGRPLCKLKSLHVRGRAGSVEVTQDHCGYTIPDPVFAEWPDARMEDVSDKDLLGLLVDGKPRAAHCRECLKNNHFEYFQILKG